MHALAAAPERRLDEQWEPDPRRLLPRHGDVDRLPRPGDDGDARRVGDPSRRGLVPQELDRHRWRTHERESGLLDGRGEVRPLGEEAVAGVDQRRARLLGGLEDRPDREIGVAREGRTDPVRLIGHLDVQRVAVGIGVHGDGRDPHLAARPHDANRDLAAVRDQQLGSFRRGLRHSRIVLPCGLIPTPLARSATC